MVFPIKQIAINQDNTSNSSEQQSRVLLALGKAFQVFTIHPISSYTSFTEPYLGIYSDNLTAMSIGIAQHGKYCRYPCSAKLSVNKPNTGRIHMEDQV